MCVYIYIYIYGPGAGVARLPQVSRCRAAQGAQVLQAESLPQGRSGRVGHHERLVAGAAQRD